MTDDEFYDLAESLTDAYADRVGTELPILRSYASGGEWGELVDDLIATLVHNGTPVSAAERDDLAALVAQLKLTPTEPLEKLTVRA